MATKTKEAKGVVDPVATIQNAIREIQRAQTQAATYISRTDQTFTHLQDAQTELSLAAYHLRRLLEASKRGRSPSERERVLSVVRKHVAKRVQTLSRQHPSKSKVGVRKRVPLQSVGKEWGDPNLPF